MCFCFSTCDSIDKIDIHELRNSKGERERREKERNRDRQEAPVEAQIVMEKK